MALRVPKSDASDEELERFRSEWFNYENPVRNRTLELAARNLLYYQDEQWVKLDTALIGSSGNGYSYRRLANDDIPKPVTNFIADAVEAELGSFASRKLIPLVLPTSADPSIKAAAKAGEAILQYKLDKMQWGSIRNDFDLHRCLFPLALMWLRWDESYFDKVATYNEGAMRCSNESCDMRLSSPIVDSITLSKKQVSNPDSIMIGESGETSTLTTCPQCAEPSQLVPLEGMTAAIAQEKDYFGRTLGIERPKGEPVIEVPTRFDYFPENSGIGLTPRSVRVHGFAMVRPIPWIEERYPDLGEIQPEDATELLRWHPSVNSWDVIGNLLTSQAEVYSDHCRVYTLIVEPCMDYPDGCVMEWVGERLAKKYPLLREVDGEKARTHVVAIARHKIVPTRLDGRSLVDSGISMQNRINTIDSQLVETRSRMGKPGIMSPGNVSMDSPEWQSKYGGLIMRWDPSPLAPGAKPEFFGGNLFPVEVYNERSACVEDLRAIIGPKGVETGEPPKNVSTTSGLQLLGEQIDKRRAPREEERLAAFTQIWEGLLTQLSVFRSELDGDCYAILDSTGVWTQQQFDKTTLKGQTKVKIDAQAEVSKSLIQKEAVREAQADSLIDVSTPVARKRVLELRGLPTSINEDLNFQVDCAERAWVAFRDDGEVPVIDYGVDDPAIRYQVLAARLLSEEGSLMQDRVAWKKILPHIAGWEQELLKVEQADALSRMTYPDTNKEAADLQFAKLTEIYAKQKKQYEVAAQASTQAQQLGGQPAALPPAPQPPPPPFFAPRDLAQRIQMVWIKMVQDAIKSGANIAPQGFMAPQMAAGTQKAFLGLMSVVYAYKRLAQQAAMAAQAPPAGAAGPTPNGGGAPPGAPPAPPSQPPM